LATSNTTLQILNLASGKIHADGVSSLAKALETNSTLHTLHLSGNAFAADGERQMATALATNATLQRLVLETDPRADPDSPEITALLVRNRHNIARKADTLFSLLLAVLFHLTQQQL
jgi:hypothetical protein